nr:unnamed protein product [Callosobruchus analis]CAI5857270.1 unnamed protein product [Callosobruchus analis]CAI5864086.1 unnamed protein product [Callosobruchus analis]CAI5867998.1 unnamed protein product [Callosobruchus analis]
MGGRRQKRKIPSQTCSGRNFIFLRGLFDLDNSNRGRFEQQTHVPLSPEPNDLSPLTPAHFLLGRSMQDVPEANFTPLPANRLSSYEFICKLKQQFWERWSKEYITETKMEEDKNTLQVGQMVLVKEPNLPPLKWRLGRVLSLIPGPDDVPRVAVLKTSIGTIKRALNRLCVLPVHHYVENTIFKAGGNVQETADYATVEEYADSAAA